MKLGGAQLWRGTTSTDWLVICSALLIVTATYLGNRVMLWRDPAADNFLRFATFGEESGGVVGPKVSRWSWAGANEALAPAGFPGSPFVRPKLVTPPIEVRTVSEDTLGVSGGRTGVRRRAQTALYRSSTSLPRDRWGSRWHLVLSYTEIGDVGASHMSSVYSPGPNQTFEWGAGDDIHVGPNGAFSWPNLSLFYGLVLLFTGPYLGFRLSRVLPRMKPWKEIVFTAAASVPCVALAETTEWPIAFAVLVLVTYTALRVSGIPRQRRIWKEIVISTAIPAPFVVLLGGNAWELFASPFSNPWLLVTPATAMYLSFALALWGFVFFWRLKKEVPEVHEDTDTSLGACPRRPPRGAEPERVLVATRPGAR